MKVLMLFLILTMPIISLTAGELDPIQKKYSGRINSENKRHNKEIKKFKSLMIKDYTILRKQKMKQDKLEEAIEIKKKIDALKSSMEAKDGDHEKSFGFKIGASSNSSRGKPRWISKNATYTTSSTHGNNKLNPALLTGKNENGDLSFHTSNYDKTGKNQWCIVDLWSIHKIKSIEIQNRKKISPKIINGAEVLISEDGKKWKKIGTIKYEPKKEWYTFKGRTRLARYVKILQPSGDYLHLRTIKIYGY